MSREREFNDRKPIGDEPTCDICGATLQGGGTRPVDNVAIIACPDDEDTARDSVLVGGEVIIRQKVEE